MSNVKVKLLGSWVPVIGLIDLTGVLCLIGSISAINSGMWYSVVILFVLFVCVEFIVPLENFSLVWRRHHCRWRAVNFDLCLVLMAIEQWGFFNVPHPLRHVPTIYNGHLRRPVTLTPNTSVWQWSCHYLFLRLGSVVTRDWTPISRMRGERSTSTQWKCIVPLKVFFSTPGHFPDKLSA